MANPTLTAQKDAINVAMKGVPYIAKGLRMSPAQADLLYKQLDRAFTTIEWVEDNEKDIREDIVAKRRAP
ncbi:hypothetical protein CHELA1G11_12026 [Hyphomicrobiales bacterium]|nr:hypothetical protein CHELA1G11_12026 [Hyphomicrobiales bacterium]